MKNLIFTKTILILISIISNFNYVKAISYTWKGNVDTVFTNAANWLPNTGYPGSIDTAIIEAGTNHPVLSQPETVLRLEMRSGSIDLKSWSLTMEELPTDFW